MALVWLVLTNPYAYSKALNRALEEAQQDRTQLKIEFLIDADALDELLRELAEKSLLGLSSRRSLQISMVEGYRALAADILDQVNQEVKPQGMTVETAIVEAPLVSYLENLLEQEGTKVIVSASHTLALPIEQLAERAILIQEG